MASASGRGSTTRRPTHHNKNQCDPDQEKQEESDMLVFLSKNLELTKKFKNP